MINFHGTPEEISMILMWLATGLAFGWVFWNWYLKKDK